MFNKISLGKVAGISIATTLSLAFCVNNAEALDFSFSGISRNIDNGLGDGTDTLTASGFFRINDAIIPSDGSSAEVSEIDLQAWEINIFNSANGATTTFNQTNSFIVTTSPFAFPSGLDVTNSVLDFSTIESATASLCITQDGSCSTDQGLLFANNSTIRLADAFSRSERTAPALVANVAATPVPFEISPTLGLMMVGGIWGVSRLRKSRKSLTK